MNAAAVKESGVTVGSAVVEFRPGQGRKLTDEDANRIGSALYALDQRLRHKATHAEIVEAAKSTYSPLHRYFDWNKESAAKRYWEMRARLLRQSVVVIVRSEGSGVPKMAQVSVARDPPVRSVPAPARPQIVRARSEQPLPSGSYRASELAGVRKQIKTILDQHPHLTELDGVRRALSVVS